MVERVLLLRRAAVTAVITILLGCGPIFWSSAAAQDAPIADRDAYLCLHGDPDARETAEACARANAAAEHGGEAPPSQPAAATLPTSAIFLQGQSDRQQYEAWFASQSGDYRAGASYWAANRSHRPAPDCSTAPFPTNPTWLAGCGDAKRRLAPLDLMRLSSPDYRRGWNSVAVTAAAPPQAPAADAVPSSAASSTDQVVSDGAFGLSAGAVGDQAAAASAAPTVVPPASASSSGLSGALTTAAIGVGLIVLVCLAGYFLPTVIATSRGKRNAGAIFALNLFLGWSLLGWVVALVWACTSNEPAVDHRGLSPTSPRAPQVPATSVPATVPAAARAEPSEAQLSLNGGLQSPLFEYEPKKSPWPVIATICVLAVLGSALWAFGNYRQKLANASPSAPVGASSMLSMSAGQVPQKTPPLSDADMAKSEAAYTVAKIAAANFIVDHPLATDAEAVEAATAAALHVADPDAKDTGEYAAADAKDWVATRKSNGSPPQATPAELAANDAAADATARRSEAAMAPADRTSGGSLTEAQNPSQGVHYFPKVGTCFDTQVASIASRLENMPDSGDAVTYTDGHYQVSYGTSAVVRAFHVSDPVRLCVIDLPGHCPSADDRGIDFVAINGRFGGRWAASDSEHDCGGA
jgi:hypothetical protein